MDAYIRNEPSSSLEKAVLTLSRIEIHVKKNDCEPNTWMFYWGREVGSVHTSVIRLMAYCRSISRYICVICFENSLIIARRINLFAAVSIPFSGVHLIGVKRTPLITSMDLSYRAVLEMLLYCFERAAVLLHFLLWLVSFSTQMLWLQVH